MMSRCSAKILLFAGRSVFLAKQVHRKSASHHSCRHDESLFGRDLTFCRPVGFSSRKSSQKECFAPRKRNCALSKIENTSYIELRTVPFLIILNIKKFFVMGATFFCASFSETKSGKKANRFEPEVSRRLS